MKPFLLSFLLSFALSFITEAHVGSAGVIVQKQVGNYQLLVSVQPPDVVPGTAQVTVTWKKAWPPASWVGPFIFLKATKVPPKLKP